MITTLLFTFLLHMDTWGLIPKSQVDPETIEQAIARMIGEHEADPVSHNGPDEAIAVHRQNEIIDHKAGSVLADKWTMSELEFSTVFENLTPFGTGGTVASIWPGARLTTAGASYPKSAYLAVDMENVGLTPYYDADFLFQFALMPYVNSAISIDAGYHTTGDKFVKTAFGMELNNTNKRFYLVDSDLVTINYLNWPTYSNDLTYVIRIQNDPTNSQLLIYINGELLGELPYTSSPNMDAGYFSFANKVTGGSDSMLQVYSLFISLAPMT